MGTVCLIGCEQSLSRDNLGMRTRPTEPAAKQRRPPRSITLAARLPAGEGIGAPISNTAVRTIGAVEGVTGISIGTDDATARAARRVGSAGWTGAGLANPLVTHGRCLVGAGGGPDPIGRGERNRRYHNEETELAHRPLPTLRLAHRHGDGIPPVRKRKYRPRDHARSDCYSIAARLLCSADARPAERRARKSTTLQSRQAARSWLRCAKRTAGARDRDPCCTRPERTAARQAARSPAASSSLIFSGGRSVTILRSWRFSICSSARMSARPRLAPLAASTAVDGAGAAR